MNNITSERIFTAVQTTNPAYSELRKLTLNNNKTPDNLTSQLINKGAAIQHLIAGGVNQLQLDSSLQSCLDGLGLGFQQISEICQLSKVLEYLSETLLIKEKIHLLPIFAASLTPAQIASDPKVKLFSTLYQQSMEDPLLPSEKDSINYFVIPQLLGLIEYFNISSIVNRLPDTAIYVEKSKVPEVVGKYRNIKKELNFCAERLAEINRNELDAKKGDFESLKAPIIEKQQWLISNLNRLPYEKRLDVNLVLIDEVLNSLKILATPSNRIIEMAKANLRSSQILLAYSIGAYEGQPSDLEFVLMKGFGKTEIQTWNPSIAALAQLSNKATQKHLLQLCHLFTKQLEILGVPIEPHLNGIANLAADKDKLWSLDSSLDGPLLNYLLHEVTEPTKKGTSAFTSINSANGVKWLFGKILRPNPLGLADYSKVFDSPGGYKPKLASDLLKLSSYIQKNKVKELADKLGLLIDDISKSSDTTLIVETISLLDAVISERSLTTRLKNQVPSLGKLSEVVVKTSGISEELAADITEKALRIQKTLSKSLTDFYREDNDLDRLFDAIDRIRLIAKKPTLYERVPGHEVVKSGIVLDGPPGVGKTFFMELLQKDTGYPLYIVSPEHGEVVDPTKMISAIKDKVEEAKLYVKAHSSPCFLFFDEGETVSPKRRPDAEYQQSLITGYVLQAVNEIRKSYPMIILVLATNYLERLDEAMIRQGRFDIVVELKKPSPALRIHIIDETLKDENIEFELTKDQFRELSEITEDFNPLPLVRTVREWNRIDPLLALERNTNFEHSFESLKSKFIKERQEMLHLKERLGKDSSNEKKV